MNIQDIYDRAVQNAKRRRFTSLSQIQRDERIMYTLASRIVEELWKNNVVALDYRYIETENGLVYGLAYKTERDNNMIQDAKYDLLVGTVVKDKHGEMGFLKMKREKDGVMCWLIDYEVKGLRWVTISDVQEMEIV